MSATIASGVTAHCAAGVLADASSSHLQFFGGIALLVVTIVGTLRYWSPGDEKKKHLRRDNILFGNRYGKLIWLTAIVGILLAISSGLIGGHASLRAGLADARPLYAATVASLAAVGLFAVVFAFVFPLLTFRMHGYSGQAGRLVLHVSRFFHLEVFTLLLVFSVLGVHARVAVATQLSPSQLAWAGAYNLVDGLVLLLLLGLFFHQCHSFVKRATHQLGTVELLARASGLLRKIVDWNAEDSYKSSVRRINEEKPRYKDRQRALPGYRLANEDQLLFVLLVCDIGAVAREAVQKGDAWATVKAITALNDLLKLIQEKRKDLKHTGTLELKHDSEPGAHRVSATQLHLPHNYSIEEDRLIEHVLKEIDDVVTVATQSGVTHILLKILQGYERELEGGIRRGLYGHEVDWYFFLLSRSRRFFYLQMSCQNPWLARRALDMLSSIATAVVEEWRKPKSLPDGDNPGVFYDCCLSQVLSSLRKYISMAIIQREHSVLRVAVNDSVQMLGLLSAEHDALPSVQRAAGSLVRMMLSGAMFALERSRGTCTEIMLDGLSRSLNGHQVLVREELAEVFSKYVRSPGETRDRDSLKEIVRSQLSNLHHDKLDLDKEDLLVNSDTMATCALAVIDLAQAYGQLTGRLSDEELRSPGLSDAVRSESERFRQAHLAWLDRASQLDSPLIAKAAHVVVTYRIFLDICAQNRAASRTTMHEYLEIISSAGGQHKKFSGRAPAKAKIQNLVANVEEAKLTTMPGDKLVARIQECFRG